MNEAMTKKRCSYQYYPPFADNSAGFSGVFPGSSPDLNTPASRPSLASFSSSSNLLRRRASFLLPKKDAKNKKLLGALDEIRRRPWLRKFLLA